MSNLRAVTFSTGCHFVTLFSFECESAWTGLFVFGSMQTKHESQHLTTMTLSAYRRATVATLVSIVTLISASPLDVWSITSLSTDPFLIKCHWLNLTSPPVSLYFPISYSHKHTHTQSERKTNNEHFHINGNNLSYHNEDLKGYSTQLLYIFKLHCISKNLPKDLIGLLWTKSAV